MCVGYMMGQKNEPGGLSFKFSEVGGPTMVGPDAKGNF